MPDPSFGDFVGESLPALGRYAYALTGNVHAAEDLVQDTLVKLSGVWSRVRRDGNPGRLAGLGPTSALSGGCWTQTRKRYVDAVS